jgi:hypothetical protein
MAAHALSGAQLTSWSLRTDHALRPGLSQSAELLLQSMTRCSWVSATPVHTGQPSWSTVPYFMALLRVYIAPATTLATNPRLCPPTLVALRRTLQSNSPVVPQTLWCASSANCVSFPATNLPSSSRGEHALRSISPPHLSWM